MFKNRQWGYILYILYSQTKQTKRKQFTEETFINIKVWDIDKMYQSEEEAEARLSEKESFPLCCDRKWS